MDKRKQRPEVQAEMLQRMIKAHGRRVGAADPEHLVKLLELENVLSGAIEDAVRSLHRQGFSWAEIGRPAGLSKQAAQQRWSPVRPRPCTHCFLTIRDTFGTIDGKDYCLPCWNPRAAAAAK